MVKAKRSDAIHTAILIFFFSFGGALTWKGGTGVGSLEWLIAGMISALVLIALALLVKKIPFCSSESGGADRSMISLLFAVAVALISLEVAIDAVCEYACLTKNVMFLDADVLLPVFLLIIPAYMLCGHAKSIVKFAPLAFFIGIPVFLLLFFASFDMSSVTEQLETWSFTLEKLPEAYAEGFAFVGLVMLCVKKTGVLPSEGAAIGALIGGIFSGLLALQIASVLGGAYAAELVYPYAEAVSAVTFGGNMTRPDGLGYTLVTLCLFIRLSVAGDAFTAAAEPFFGERRLPNLLFFTLTVILCLFFGNLSA